MKIKILIDTVCGRNDVSRGDIIEASDGDARILIGMKKAEKFDSEKETIGRNKKR